MKKHNNIWLVEIPQMILIIFIIFQIIAMITYSGGTFFDPHNSGYSLTRNFLSDLGRTEGFSGDINYISSMLFNISIFFAGVVFVIFYINIYYIFVQYNYMGLASIGSVLGVMTGVALAGVGLTPADIYLPTHIIAAKWLFRCFFGASLCYSIIIYRSDFIENKYALYYLVFAFSILAFIFVSELGPSPKESELALSIQVISQKIILLILVFTVYLQTLGIKKLRI